MDERVAKQLARQLKIMNFWITFFGTIIVILMLTIGFFVYKTVVFVRTTQEQIVQIQTKAADTLNIKDDVCKNALLSTTEYCK
ncbi:MAG: hypothetical protein QG629_461 [Patescibacteria group bacterium]|nr:hypothetical protein [Patescibacteria group bacterium]